MPVEVQKEYQTIFVFIFQLDNKLFKSFHLGDKKVIRHFKSTVQVPPAKRSSEVPHNHAVRIEHRDQLENHAFPQLSGL